MNVEGDRALLLDTHIWVWYVENEPKRFSRKIEPLIEAAVQRGELLVSTISVWEIAMLESTRRIELSQDVRTWAGRALAFPGVRLKGHRAEPQGPSQYMSLHQDAPYPSLVSHWANRY